MGEQETIKRKTLIIILLPLLLCSFLSVGYAQLSVDTSIISMSGADWSLKVDSVLASSIDSRNTPYMTAKSSTEKELFLELATLEDCKSGVVQFKVDMAGLTAYKQYPLTQEEINEGSFRPKNVENSFALFDSNGKKVAHIYGSKITDSKGVEVWLDQNLQDGLLTVILPKPEVLVTLTFPLVLDPTFGYTSVGASNGGYSGSVYWFNLFYVDALADLSSLWYYPNVTANARVAVYNATYDTHLPTSLIWESSSAATTEESWNEFVVDTQFEVSHYYFALQSQTGNLVYYYDTVTGAGLYSQTMTYGSFPAIYEGSLAYSNRKVSMFANYTYQSVTPTPTPAPSTTYGANIAEGDMEDSDWYISILVLALIIINLVLLMLPFALMRFTFGILSLFLCMLALSYTIPLSPYLQTAGLLISALAMLFSVRARE